jgi:hypothetical protein
VITVRFGIERPDTAALLIGVTALPDGTAWRDAIPAAAAADWDYLAAGWVDVSSWRRSGTFVSRIVLTR